MRTARLTLLTLAAVVVVLTSAVPTAAIESFGIGALPANPRADNPRSNSIFVHQIQPGQTVNDAVRIVNNSNDEKTISVYPVDSELSSDGAFACKQAVEPKASVGSWIKLEKTEIVLKPQTNQIIPFTITVPATASVGEHNGCIAVQDLKKNEATGNGIVLSFRTALRAVVMVPGEVKANLTVRELKIAFDKQKLIVSPVLHNTGNVSLDTNIQAEIKNVFGMGFATGGGKFPLLRDTTGQFNLEFDEPFWGGWYWVGGNVTYEVIQTSGEKSKTAAPIALPGTWLFVGPKPVALAIESIVLILVIAAITFAVWRKRQQKQLHRSSILYSVQPGDDIESIAKDHNVRWQLVAKMNGLKPPYKLTPGKQLKIPKK